MKKPIFLLSAIFAFCVQIQAQVVLTQANTGFLPGIVSVAGADATGFTLPSPGVNQLWDYSKLTKSAGSGVDENNQDAEISIYPNPAGEQLFITSNNNFVEFFIYNSVGELVGAGTTNDKTIKINELPKGLYYTILKTVDQTKTIKFIKN